MVPEESFVDALNSPKDKQVKPALSLEAKMLKLRLSYFGHTMRRQNSGKDMNAGKNERQQEKRKTKYKMDGLPKRSHRFEFVMCH